MDHEADPTGLLGFGLVFPDDATKQRELAANAGRIEGWRQSISYKYFQKVIVIIYIYITEKRKKIKEFLMNFILIILFI